MLQCCMMRGLMLKPPKSRWGIHRLRLRKIYILILANDAVRTPGKESTLNLEQEHRKYTVTVKMPMNKEVEYIGKI